MPSRRDVVAGLGATAASLLLPASAAPFAPAPLAPSQPRGRLTDAEVVRLLHLASVPSASWVLIDGDRATAHAVGVRRAGTTEPATPDTVYAAASLTKAVVAYTVLSLVQDGALTLDRPLRELLPLPNPEDPRAAGITARRLLSHSGGWRNWRNTAEQRLTIDFEPGARWSYSGEGYFYLARVAESLTGRAIGQLARERVFDPLRMTRSSLVGLEELESHQASGHGGRGDPTTPFGRATLLELRRLMKEKGASLEAARLDDIERALRSAEPQFPLVPNFMSPNAAASMLTTPADFGRFLAHLATARKAGGSPAAIVDLMMQPQVRCNDAVSWGLGVGIERIGADSYAWQWGDNPGFKNFFALDPLNGRGIAVFTNGDRGARVYERIIRGLTGVDHPGFLWS